VGDMKPVELHVLLPGFDLTNAVEAF
jgi:hypothetical protein